MACRSRPPIGHCLLAALGGAFLLPAQTPTPPILGILRDETGAPVVAAALAFVPDRLPDVPCARNVRVPLPAVRGQSDRSGGYRIQADRPGLLLATTPSGLGTVVERCWPGRAERLLLRPMAEIARHDGQEIAVYAAVGGSHNRRHLPPQTGTAVRLPAGRYEAWVREPEGWSWRELTLRPGEQTTLATQMASRTLDVGQTALRPAGFAMLDWWARGDRTVALLGAAGQAELIVHGIDPASQSTLFLALQRHGSAWLPRPTVHATTAAAVLGAGSELVLAIRDDNAARVLAADAAPAAADPVFETGRTLTCRVWTPDGQPALGVEIAFAPAVDQPTTAAATTDALGAADLRHVTGSGLLQVDDPRWRAHSAMIDADVATFEIRLELGATLSGTVVLPDGSPAIGVAVTLSDASAGAGRRERTLQAGADGSFAFAGLQEQQRVRVFAAQRREQRMWRAELVSMSGATGLRLVLRDEDPSLQPPTNR